MESTAASTSSTSVLRKRFDKVEIELHRINDRLDGMGRAMNFAAFSMTGAILAGYAAIDGR